MKMNKNKNKILFLTTKSPHYRIPFFDGLSKKLNIKFAFTHESKKINGLNVSYKSLRGIGYKKFRVTSSLINEIKKERPDRVVMLPPDALNLINNIILYTSLRKKGIPYTVWTERWKYKNIPFKDYISKIFYKMLYKNADTVIVSGKKSFEYAISNGIPKKNISIAPDASEIIYDKNRAERLKKNLIKKYNLKNKKIILYVGRLISRKGVDYLISAFSKVKNPGAVLLIVGGGDFYSRGEKSTEFKLKDQVKRLGIKDKIIFEGEVEHSSLASYYLVADVFVMPSITEKIGEPWGLTLNEAMQFGLPAVATDAVGSAYDLIKNGKNGYVIPEKDVDELRDSIDKIISNPSLMRRMGKESKKVVKDRYNYKEMIKGFLEGLNK